MQITDLNGDAIKITDLPRAIQQAEEFIGYRHTDKSLQAMDARLCAYWTDIYNKLLQLKQGCNAINE